MGHSEKSIKRGRRSSGRTGGGALRLVRNGLLGLAAIIVLTIGAQAHRGQTQASLPKPEEILERYVKALGGKDAILKHKSRTRTGTFKSASGLTATIVEYIKPYKALTKLSAGGAEYVQGFDGQVAWQSAPNAAPSLTEPFIAEFWKREGDLYYPTHIRDYFRTFETAGVVDFEGRPCYHIKGVTNWGDSNEQFYDKQTGLLAGYRFPSGGSKDAPLVVQVFSDYEEYSGVLVPTTETAKQGQAVTTIRYASVSFDDVDDAIFKLPESLKQKGK